MRLGYERSGGIVRERMQAEPRSRALFVFVGNREHTIRILTWDGTGAILLHKKLDAGRFELPKATCIGEQVMVAASRPHASGIMLSRTCSSSRNVFASW